MTTTTKTIIPEVLSPAGNIAKFYSAMHFGADAVYLAGRKYGLRTSTDNFDRQELEIAVNYAHSLSRKVYVTLNIVAHNNDFLQLPEYLKFINTIGVDGLIISDMGIFGLAKEYAPKVDLHVSTQANITNKYTAKAWIEMGAKRIIPARELRLIEIEELRQSIPDNVEIETFVHGAMCMAYSGRCLLSNYSSSRQSNKGACNHSCRWEYTIKDSKTGEEMIVNEDERGSYIFNSKDLCMIAHLDKLIKAGVVSFKIEGRSKSQYYTGSVTNAYRRAVDFLIKNPNSPMDESILDEINKIHSRGYSTGLYFGRHSDQDFNYTESNSKSQYDVVAIVLDNQNGIPIVEHRNKWIQGDELEVVSPNNTHNTKILVDKMTDMFDSQITVANQVQQHIKLYTDVLLRKGDMLRKKVS
ncbi:MAG: U32 family peptidase [Firmicutes bacterium]|nr:U32 family peptidase [Bacillota bacterium]